MWKPIRKTSSHASRQGTLGHSRPSLWGHCGLILTYRVEFQKKKKAQVGNKISNSPPASKSRMQRKSNHHRNYHKFPLLSVEYVRMRPCLLRLIFCGLPVHLASFSPFDRENQNFFFFKVYPLFQSVSFITG